MSNKSIKIESMLSRILLAVTALVCVAAVFFAFTWMFADSISANAQDIEVAEFAASLAPHNPQSHYTIAVLREKSFLPEDIPKSLAEFEKAASLSPNDYRLWLALGKARERSGNTKGAELAFQRALELAPNYAQVQWAYGNNLLRQGKNKEAFVQIGRAVENDPNFANPAVNTAWQLFNGDLDKVKQVVGDSNHTRAALASFFVKQGNFTEAMNVWNSIPVNEKKVTFRKEGADLFTSLIAAQKYRTALQVQNQFAENNSNNAAIGKVNNGSFEENINAEEADAFRWKLGQGVKPQIGVDNREKHSGDKSLILVFGGGDNKDFRNISQIVPVEGGKQYSLKLFYKSDLDTNAKFAWEAVNPADNSVIASTDTTIEKADWTSLSANFTTPEAAEGIILRLVRRECSSILCPTSGKLWFDDISLN